jgi:hypothetical protein
MRIIATDAINLIVELYAQCDPEVMLHGTRPALGASTPSRGFEYYCTARGQHPCSAKSLTWSSVDHMAFFDAFRFVGLTRRPLLMNVGREAVA